MNKLLLVCALFLALALIVEDCEAHEEHMGELGVHTNVTIGPCPILSGYLVHSDQRECFLIYKQTTLSHSGLHVQDIELNQDGKCVCPKIERYSQ
jgi:hypothetical protein